MADEAYYFDGSEGCDQCDGMTGYYLDEPEGPHDGCNCPIQSVSADLSYEFRSVTWQQGSVHLEREDDYDNCESDEESYNGILLDEEVEEAFDTGLREAAEAAGWAEPATQDLNASFQMPPHTMGTLKLVIHRYVAEFEGEVWAIFPDDTEQYVGDAVGYYEKNVNIDDAEFAGRSCDPDLDRWIPRSDDDDSDDADDSDSDDLIV